MRTFLLAVLAIVACVWAIVSYATRPHRSMLVPMPSASSRDEGEIPVPEVVPVE